MQVEEIKNFSASCIPDSLNLENSITDSDISCVHKDKRPENSHDKQLASHMLGRGR